MPRENDLFQEEESFGFKPLDPGAIAPTGVGETGLLPEEDTVPTEDEQSQYEQVTLKAGEIIHGANTAEGVINKMNDPTKPVHETVGNAAALIGKTVIGMMEAGGEEPNPVVILSVAEDYVIPELFELGQAAKVIPDMGPDEEQQEMQLAILHAEQVYGNAQAKAGKLPTEEARSIMNEELMREGQGYSVDKFLTDAGVDDKKPGGELPDAPAPMGAGGPPGKMNPISQAVSQAGQGAPPGELFGG